MLGQTFPLTATGTLTLDGDELVVDVERASGAGVDLPDFLVERASDLLDLRYAVPALPFGLQLTDVTPAEDGVDVRRGGRGHGPQRLNRRPGNSSTGSVGLVRA